MSGIVGLWNLDGRPVDRAILARMSAALAHRGPDGERMWLDGATGLSCQLFRVTPESALETQPLVSPSGAVLVFDGRLDNREGLLARLHGDPAVRADAPDSTLVLAAYRRAEGDLPVWLSGDFALALFDPARRRLLLARDALGVKPLYYARTGATFLFASEIKALLAHPALPRKPNEARLADVLLHRFHDTALTFFQGVYSMPPSHLGIVTPGGVRTRSYWDFEPTHRVRLGSFEAYAEAFGSLFAQAVRRRLRSSYPVAVLVSGGLDSSSIFCQADRARRADRSHPGLFGISHTAANGTPSDEQAFLTHLERDDGPKIMRIPPGPLRVLEGSRRGMPYIEAPFLDEQWGNTERNLSAAGARGARTVLTGHWGDQFLFSQAYLVDLTRRLRWRTVHAHLGEFPRWLTDADPAVFSRRFVRDLVKHHAPASLLPALRTIRPARQAGPWYTETFRQLAERRRHQRPQVGAHFPSAHARAMYETARAGYYTFCLEYDNKIAAMHGVELAFPFLDRDLIQFLMAVPGDMHASQGVPKALLREAMRGIVPEPIRARRWKADFAQLVNGEMDGQYPQLLQFLESGGRAVAFGYVDGPGLARHVASIRDALQRTDCRAAHLLGRLVGLELWLQTFFGPRPRAGEMSPRAAEAVGAAP